jgi:cystathionine beta-synthase
MKVFGNVLEMIGRTPMLELRQLDAGPCRLFLKLELQNPGGSIKDRIGLTMIEEAERRGDLKPGGTIIEATAGNTGLGLALVAAQKGYRVVLVLPDKMSQEKIFNLRAMGAEVVLTRSDVEKGHPSTTRTRRGSHASMDISTSTARQSRHPKAHATTTGPEILEQMEGQVDAVVVGIGSRGRSRPTQCFRERLPSVDHPGRSRGPVLADQGEPGPLRQGRLVARRGHRRGFHPGHLRLMCRKATHSDGVFSPSRARSR